MKERPILFSRPMVLALLAGTKTMTRRIVKLGVARPDEHGFEQSEAAPLSWLGCDVDGTTIVQRCPYGVPGDRLWVRETWRPHDALGTAYAANYDEHTAATWRWKPSIHMKRTASRIDLEITAVRVERLQDITEEDAKAEGLDPSRAESLGFGMRQAFRALWDEINGGRATWASNPWVWAVGFKRIRP